MTQFEYANASLLLSYELQVRFCYQTLTISLLTKNRYGHSNFCFLGKYGVMLSLLYIFICVCTHFVRCHQAIISV